MLKLIQQAMVDLSDEKRRLMVNVKDAPDHEKEILVEVSNRIDWQAKFLQTWARNYDPRTETA